MNTTKETQKPRNSCNMSYLRRTFRHPRTKEKLFQLRRDGHSLHALADMFNVDHTTIVYHLKRAGVKKGGKNNNVKKRRSFLFSNPKTKEELYKMRRDGCSIMELSSFFKVDRSSILYHLRKGNVRPSKLIYRDNSTDPLLKIDHRGVEWHKGINDEWVCNGKNFKELLSDEKNRKKTVLEKHRDKLLEY